MAGKRSPWGKPSGNNGGSEGGGSSGGPSGDGDKPRGPRNPWLPGGGGSSDGPRRSASIEDIFKNRGPEGPRRGGGTGGPNFRLPQRPGGKSWLPIGIAAVVVVWLLTTSLHFVQPREQGVVTWLGGKYSHTMNSGTNWTLPWPIQIASVENVQEIRVQSIPGSNNEEKLILTADQNLVNLSYLVRYNIADLTLFEYQLADPEGTLREVAEATMRAAVAQQSLDTVLTGAGRNEIEAQVLANTQGILDAYRSGISVQNVNIDNTGPPSRVEEAFKDVSSAQQDADAALNRARAYAQRLLNRAQGDAAEFNNIYAEYRLAPEVTRRRLYYETMESVLAKTDKTVIEGGSGVTPYLPLPEVRRRQQQQVTAPAANNAGRPATPVNPTGGQ